MKKSVEYGVLVIIIGFSCLDLTAIFSAVLFVAVIFIVSDLDKHPLTVFTPFVFVSVAYFMGFTSTVLFPDLYPLLYEKVHPSSIQYAMLWVLRGYEAFAVSYLLTTMIYSRKRLPNTSALTVVQNKYSTYILLSTGLLVVVSWLLKVLLYGISLVFVENKELQSNGESGSLLQILTLIWDLRYAFFLGFVYLRVKGQKNILLSIILGIITIFTLTEVVSVGSKGIIIALIVDMLLVGCFLSVKFSFKQILIVSISVLAIYGAFSIITEYRLLINQQLRFGVDITDISNQMNSFKKAFVAALPFNESNISKQEKIVQNEILNRFGSGMFSLANLIYFTHEHSPYEYSLETFFVPLYSVLPRNVMSEKPIFFNSGRNAREFYNWKYGGISVTLIGSLYYCWGYYGIIVGMAFIGSILSILFRNILNGSMWTMDWIILFISYILKLMDVGTTYHFIMNDICRIIILLFFLRILFKIILNKYYAHFFKKLAFR